MIALHFNKVRLIQSNYIIDTASQYNEALKKLLDLHKNTADVNDLRYVRKICIMFRKHPDIITALPDQLQRIAGFIGSVPIQRVPYTRNGRTHLRNKKSDIWKKIVEALGYEELRSSFYPRYFSHLGIKSCVYCNAQYTLSIEKRSGIVTAKYDVDHYRPKSSFPWQCISLFNLYPSCAPCNRAKAGSLIDFNLYSDIPDAISSSAFQFRLDASSKSNFLTSKNINDIKFVFENNIGTNDHDEMFSITPIYETQQDLAAELIISSQMYDKAARESLMRNFSRLHISKDVFNRVILGNYTSEKDIHRRPMSKFSQDIAKDLGIL